MGQCISSNLDEQVQAVQPFKQNLVQTDGQTAEHASTNTHEASDLQHVQSMLRLNSQILAVHDSSQHAPAPAESDWLSLPQDIKDRVLFARLRFDELLPSWIIKVSKCNRASLSLPWVLAVVALTQPLLVAAGNSKTAAKPK